MGRQASGFAAPRAPAARLRRGPSPCGSAANVMKDHNPMHPCTLTTALPYLRIPKRRILTKRKDSRTSPGLFRSQGCRYGRIRTRFAPARRAALLLRCLHSQPRSETLLVGHGPTANFRNFRNFRNCMQFFGNNLRQFEAICWGRLLITTRCPFLLSRKN